MIREYRQSDRESMMELWRLFDRVHIDAMPERFREPSEEQRALRHDKYAAGPRDAGRPSHFMLVAEEGGAVNGFVCGAIRETPDVALLVNSVVIELHAVYVRNGWRKGRVSAELVRRALSIGKENGAETAVCHIWNFNAAARRHVERLGFRGVSAKYEKSIT
ncbi:MAG TPA: GNAT family N-acetyltransferase [Treponemataceae bacterium]|nr:GNAT family N-acetyltransferase [Treponemataceae bacterium]